MTCVAQEIQPQLQPVALLIPGIGIAYSKALEQIKYDPLFQTRCKKVGIEDFGNADMGTLSDYEHFLRDTLENQKISYIVNCSMCDIYRKRGINTKFVVGYSMGIYAALYSGGYYSFETGLHIVEKAFHLVKDFCSSKPKKYGMGLILGLKADEIDELLFKRIGEGVDIAVYNGKRNFVISGEKGKLDFCLEKALLAGAFVARPILTEHPYHNAFLKGISHNFSAFLNTLDYTPPFCSAVSLVDGNIISENEVADAIVKAIYTPLRFDMVIDMLFNRHNIAFCYETGPFQSMKKLVRYINKKIKVHPFER